MRINRTEGREWRKMFRAMMAVYVFAATMAIVAITIDNAVTPPPLMWW